MTNLIKYLQNINTYIYLLILGISLVYVQMKKNKVPINIFFNLLISVPYYCITKNMVPVIIFTSIVSLVKMFWVLNNKELLKIEESLRILDRIEITKTKEILNIIKSRKTYNFDKKLSINLLVVGILLISTQLSNIIGTFSLENQEIFIKILLFCIMTILASIYFGLKTEKLLNKIERKVKACIKIQNNTIL